MNSIFGNQDIGVNVGSSNESININTSTERKNIDIFVQRQGTTDISVNDTSKNLGIKFSSGSSIISVTPCSCDRDMDIFVDQPGVAEISIDGNPTGCKVLYDTTANWNAKPQLISKKGYIYIYSDYKKDGQGNDIAGMKVGNGNAYLIDLEFTDEFVLSMLDEHIRDNIRHITQAEREFWNNKVRCYTSTVDGDELIFTTN